MKLAENPFVIGYQGKWKKKEVSLCEEDLLKHVLVVGQQGLGQERLWLYPTIRKIKYSFIVIDDGRAYQNTSDKEKMLLHCGNPESVKFNWIPYCKDSATARRVARASLFDTEKDVEGNRVLVGIAFLVAIYAYTATLDSPTPISAYNLICDNNLTQLVSILGESNNEVVSGLVASVIRMDKRSIEECYLELKKKLSWVQNEKVISFTSTIDLIDFVELRKEEIGVYVVMPEVSEGEELDCEGVRSLCRIILTCALNELVNGDSKEKPVYIFMRHLTDIGYFSYVSSLAYLSKNNIGLIASCQSRVDNWLHYYSEVIARGILAGFHTKIFLEDRAYYLFAKYLTSDEQTISNQSLMNKKRNQGKGETFSIAECFKDYLVLIKGQKPFQVLKPMQKQQQ